MSARAVSRALSASPWVPGKIIVTFYLLVDLVSSWLWVSLPPASLPQPTLNIPTPPSARRWHPASRAPSHIARASCAGPSEPPCLHDQSLKNLWAQRGGRTRIIDLPAPCSHQGGSLLPILFCTPPLPTLSHCGAKTEISAGR